MNQTYDKFIQNILDTRGRFGCGDEYHERHHILPRCMSGTNDKENLIDLFAREHFEAHRLLALENPENDHLVYAWWMMAHIDDREVTSEEYEEARSKFAEIASLRIKGENHPNYGKPAWNRGVPAWNKGKHWSEETRKKMSEAKRGKYDGENNPMYGVPSPNKGKHTSVKTRKKMSESAKARYENPEERKKTSNAQKKRFENPEEREKVAGKNNPRARKVIRLLDLKIYGCMIDASQDNNVYVGTIRNRCRIHKEFMYYDEWITIQNDYKEGEI